VMEGEVVDGDVVEDHETSAPTHAEQHGPDTTAGKLDEPQS
jgi:hypothetical protein